MQASPEFAGLADILFVTQHNLKKKIILLCVGMLVFLIKITNGEQQFFYSVQMVQIPNSIPNAELALLSSVCLI
jgi:hypothetical protein